jgi:hypothetical protein
MGIQPLHAGYRIAGCDCHALQHLDRQYPRLTEEPSYLFDTEGMQSYRNDVALADRLPSEIREGVMALIRLERVKYGR